MPKFAPLQVPTECRGMHGFAMRIPWRIHQKAWEVYAQHHSCQSAERLAERGGFGLLELIYLLAGEDPYAPHSDDFPMHTDFFGRWPEGGE